MAVQFVRNTHYLFSVGKDRLVKYWDGDKFELLLTLRGHHAEIWCLSISNHGDFLVTGSHDRSIHRWDRTEEPFFIEVSFLSFQFYIIQSIFIGCILGLVKLFKSTAGVPKLIKGPIDNTLKC